MTRNLANYRGTFIYADEPQGETQGTTIDVSQFPPNAFGLYNMHGNVFEWCLDSWHDNDENAPTNGKVWDRPDYASYYDNLKAHLAILLCNRRLCIVRGGDLDIPIPFLLVVSAFLYMRVTMTLILASELSVMIVELKFNTK